MPDGTLQQNPVVKSGRPRQKPIKSEIPPDAANTAKYRCTRQRQYRGRMMYPDDVCTLPSPLPKGFGDYFEQIGTAEKKKETANRGGREEKKDDESPDEKNEKTTN